MSTLNANKKNQTIVKPGKECTLIDADNSDDTTSIHVHRQYSLNKKKALQKKLENCQANTMIEMKDNGRQMVLSCSTAYYEHLKSNIIQYFCMMNETSNTLAIDTRNVADSNGLIVEHVLRITNRLKHTGNPGQRTKFVMNLYNTTNRILANGSCLYLLMNNHLPEILSQTEKTGQHAITEENRKLAQILSTMIKGSTTTASEISSMATAESPAPTTTENSEAEPARLTEMCQCTESDRKLLCPECKTHTCMDTIECEQCANWYHYPCTKLPKKEIQKYENDTSLKYVCPLCTTLNETVQHSMDQDEKSRDKLAKVPAPNPSAHSPDDRKQAEDSKEAPNLKGNTKDCRCEGTDKTSLCPACSKHACLETIKCSKCGMWHHFACSGLSEIEMESLMNSPTAQYVCKSCHNNSQQTESTQKENSNTIPNIILDSDVDEDIYLICPICCSDATKDSIECLACENWYHLTCADMNPSASSSNSQKDNYICSSCTLIDLTTTTEVHVEEIRPEDRAEEANANPQNEPYSQKSNTTSATTQTSDEDQLMPPMNSQQAQHNTTQKEEHINQHTARYNSSTNCKTCKERGKQIQKLKDEIKSKCATISTLLLENEKSAHDFAQARREIELAEEQNQHSRNILEQKQIDLANANFHKTQYQLDFNRIVAHNDALHLLCLKHGINIPQPEPETSFLKRSNEDNTRKAHQRKRHSDDNPEYYSIPTHKRFSCLSIGKQQ